jgi:hypothetical protein
VPKLARRCIPRKCGLKFGMKDVLAFHRGPGKPSFL